MLAGSSGRIDTARVDMLTERGVTALGLRWFGGEGLPPVPAQVPLEFLSEALDALADECDRLVAVGLSYGAEAALLMATRDPRLDGVIALAPSDVAWEGQASNDDDPALSKWTYGGQGIPFVPIDRTWQPAAGKPAFVELYEQSRLVAGPAIVEAATIPVELIRGDLVLVAGGDDKVWPSFMMAQRIKDRRDSAGLVTTVVADAAAGHPVVLPGEAFAALERPYLVGGDSDAPVRLGRAAWPAIARVLHVEE